MRPSSGSFPFADYGGTVWLAFNDWGDPDNKHVVVCVHGLTRQGRDFDWLARAIYRDIRVIEVDIVGRGRSGWLGDKTKYGMETYIRHMHALLDYRGIQRCDWIGTSMGGIIGMAIAAGEDSPIERLILNDVGAVIPKEALERIGSYAGHAPTFPNMTAAMHYLQEVHADFGITSEADWSEFTTHSVNREANGPYTLHYDPAIGDAFEGELNDVVLWGWYDMISCPTLLLRGSRSDLLSRQTAEEMTQRGPHAELVEFPGVGHAPALIDEDQIAVVHEFLMRGRDEEEEEEEGPEELSAEAADAPAPDEGAGTEQTGA